MVDLKRQAGLLEAIELLYFAYRAFTARADRILEHHGLGRAHHRILYFVGRHPDIAIHALLDILKISKQALNAPLRRLLAEDLVSVGAAGHDHRTKLLRLTKAGHTLESQLTASQTEQLAEVFKKVGWDAEKDWRQVMAHLADDPHSP